MNLDLTDDEKTALEKELDRIIRDDRYFLSPRIQTLREDSQYDPTGADTQTPPRSGTRRLPVFGSSSGASNADIRSSPIPPKWRDDTAPRLPLPTGISGSSVPVAGAIKLIWW
jgi:hypothetical protein